MNIRRYAITAILFLMLLAAFPAGSLGALKLSSISFVELVPYSDDTLSFTAEETLIAGLSPVWSLLARLQYRNNDGNGITTVSAGPIVVFGEGLYAEIIYGAGFQGDRLSHSLGLEVTREKDNTILAAGAEGNIEEAAGESSLTMTMSSWFGFYRPFSPRAKYFLTLEEDGGSTHALLLSLGIKKLPRLAFVPSFSLEREDLPGYSVRWGFSMGNTFIASIGEGMKLKYLPEYRRLPDGRSAFANSIVLDIRGQR
jgi:hypothetical protein